MTEFHPDDLDEWIEYGSLQQTIPFSNTYNFPINNYSIFTPHKIISNRDFVNRGYWEALLNYLGIGAKNTVNVIDLQREAVELHHRIGFSVAGDPKPITQVDEIRYGFYFFQSPHFKLTYYYSRRLNTIASFFSHFGGIFGLFVWVYVFFFGWLPESPWGFVQNIKIYLKWDAEKKRVEDRIEGTYRLCD